MEKEQLSGAIRSDCRTMEKMRNRTRLDVGEGPTFQTGCTGQLRRLCWTDSPSESQIGRNQKKIFIKLMQKPNYREKHEFPPNQQGHRITVSTNRLVHHQRDPVQPTKPSAHALVDTGHNSRTNLLF
ncbi:hypothetical protein CEXT_547641 [Caerostris extrusa]|uniref:Uncharacterized protein n=1 Tax=Caerostris extrusa TaxID=172846 RepID=A0AAV4N3P2_CAEEX|nr:hypothetical protein CEXT_547641 [Caerostris extrusa]